MHLGDISFTHKRSNHRAALQNFVAPEETRVGRGRGHGATGMLARERA